MHTGIHVGTDQKVGIQVESDGGGRKVLGEEMDEGKFFRVQGGSGGVITQATRGAITWGNNTTDAGSMRRRGSN